MVGHVWDTGFVERDSAHMNPRRVQTCSRCKCERWTPAPNESGPSGPRKVIPQAADVCPSSPGPCDRCGAVVVTGEHTDFNGQKRAAVWLCDACAEAEESAFKERLAESKKAHQAEREARIVALTTKTPRELAKRIVELEDGEDGEDGEEE